MKAALLVLAALCALAASAVARPAETLPAEASRPEVASQALLAAEGPDVDAPEARARRSPKGQAKDKERGSVSGGVHRQPGVGTVVQAQGQGNIWTSKDGNGRLDAHGHWSKVVEGPGKAKPSYGGGITYSHSF